MALQTTGPISFQDIQGEFGGSNPIAINEYYRGGGAVPISAPAGSGSFQTAPLAPQSSVQIPTSGTIQTSMFYGTSNTVTFNITISSNELDLNMYSRALGAGWDGSTPINLTITISSGVTVSASSAVEAAVTTRSAFQTYPAGSSITLINNGVIAGRGGAGGQGGSVSGGSVGNGIAGENGGPAVRSRDVLSIFNNGTIGGGGGGGGGGGARYYSKTGTFGIGGSGGGGGRAAQVAGSTANGGLAGTASGNTTNQNGSSGASGTSSAPGAGGLSQGVIDGGEGGAGGAGGGLGQPGSPGLPSTTAGGTNSLGGAGGLPGAAVTFELGGTVLWRAFGSIFGSGFTMPFTLSAPASVNEGSSFTVTLNGTSTAPDISQFITYTITGVTSADISGASLSDSFTFPASPSRTFTAAADTTTEGTEIFTLSLNPPTGQAAGSMPSVSVTINDTSVSTGGVQPSASGTWQANGTQFGSQATASLGFNSSGTVSVGAGNFGLTPNWFTPTTANIGSSYWIRATLVSSSGSGSVSGTFNTWISLSAGANWFVQSGPGSFGSHTANITFQFATDSLGTNIVATHTNCVLTADHES